jgi:hypothetical protein
MVPVDMVRTGCLHTQPWGDAMKLAIAMKSAISVLLLAAGTTIATVPSTAHAAAPSQLFNKTVLLSWSSSGAARSDAGRSINYNISHKMTIYISSAGRLFTRYNRSSSGNIDRTDFEPGSKKSPSGHARELRFQGNQLIDSREWASGASASQVIATFDANFSSCTLSVIAGKSGGAALRAKGPDGVMYTLNSFSTSSPTCSIQNGNAFASQ